ncbi:MAG: Uma2 family endonuclease [Gemmataceae bacterium]
MSTELLDLPMMLGGIDPTRIVLHPATEADLLSSDRKCLELIDGVLVEKAMGAREAFLGMWLGSRLQQFVEQHDLGLVGGADTMMRMVGGNIREPDISFTRWERLPEADAHLQSIADFAPDFSIEILSKGNTKAEMLQKRRELFASGTIVVWEIDPVAETLSEYRKDQPVVIHHRPATVTCPDVLPGFALNLEAMFGHRQLQPRPPEKRS